jgi:hypothetical protein
MGISQSLSDLALQQLMGEDAGVLLGWVRDRFTDQGQRVLDALHNANKRAWQTLEVALAGNSWWDKVKRLLAPREDQAFAREIQSFLDASPLAELPRKTEFREKCLRELQHARKQGIIPGGRLTAEEVACLADWWVRHTDKQAVQAAEEAALAGIARELEHHLCGSLAWLIQQRPHGGPSLLVQAVRYFFRREVEGDPEAFRGLTWVELAGPDVGRSSGFDLALGDEITPAALAESKPMPDLWPPPPTTPPTHLSPVPVGAAPPPPPPLLTPARTDQVHFSVTAPLAMIASASYILSVWVHREEQRPEVIARAQAEQSGKEVRARSKGPFRVARGTILDVFLTLPKFTIDEPTDTICWEGTIGNATFTIRIPPNLALGLYPGKVHVRAEGVLVARLDFIVEVGQREAPCDVLPSREQCPRTAFASYASQDREAVLARVQGIQKVSPRLEIFLDVASLRSGQRWLERLRAAIISKDIFYLFWSLHASRSEWVEWEWRTALAARGVDYIDPVPLAPPEEVPPPRELADHLHFNDWVLAYMRPREAPEGQPALPTLLQPAAAIAAPSHLPTAPATAAPTVGAGTIPANAQPRLRVLRGQKPNVEYPLVEGPNYIGRADGDVNIDLTEQEPPDRVRCASRQALILFGKGQISLLALATAAEPTYLNRTEVQPGQPQPLKVHDIIQIGTVQLKLVV